MKPRKQQVAIAEALGWRKPNETELKEAWPNSATRKLATDPESSCFFMVPPHGEAWEGLDRGMPDFLSDLDAMRSAETALTDDQQLLYIMHLLGETEQTPSLWSLAWDSAFFCAHASAERRAEAFLRAIGKWEDEK